MVITAEAIGARKLVLMQQADKLKADLNATIGALHDCEYWLKELASLTPIAGVATARETEHVTN